MGEVAEMFDVKPSLLRHWEAKFDILRPHKNKKGNRMFTPEDVENLKLIYHLVKERGMTLAGAAQYLKNGINDSMRRDMELLDRLHKIRAELVEVREQLKDVPDGYTVVEVSQSEIEDNEPEIIVAPAQEIIEQSEPITAEPIDDEIEEIEEDNEVEVEELIEVIVEEEPTEEELVEEVVEEEPKSGTPSEEPREEEESKEEEPADSTPRPRGAKGGRRSKKQEAKLFEVKPEKQRPIAPFFDQTLF